MDSTRLRFLTVIMALLMTVACRHAAPPEPPPEPPKPPPPFASDTTDWFERGVFHYQEGRYASAIEAWDRVLEKQPELPQVWYNRGLAWLDDNHPRRAIDDFTRAIDLRPGYAMAYYNRGFAWSRVDNWSKALADFNRSARLQPENPDAHYQLAWVLALCPDEGLRDAEAAIETVRRAIDIAPRIHYHDLLAAAPASAGRPAEAVVIQRQVILWLKKEGKTEHLAPYQRRLERYRRQQARQDRAVPETVRPAAASTDARTAGTGASAGHVADPLPFAVHVSSYRSAAGAIDAAGAWRRLGFTAFTCLVDLGDKGLWHRVLVGALPTRDAARATSEHLTREGAAYTRIMHLPLAVAVTLPRTTATRAQLADRLARNGYLAYALPGPAVRQRLMVGAYARPHAARTVIERLLQDGFDARLVRR